MEPSNKIIEELKEVYKEISDNGFNISKTAQEEAILEYQERIRRQAQQWKYFCSYAVFTQEGKLKTIDSGIFFIDREVKTQSDMYYLDYTVTGFVKPEGGDFVKMVSWNCLGEPNGTV